MTDLDKVTNILEVMMRRKQRERCLKYILATVVIFIFLQTNVAKSISEYFFKSFPNMEKPAWHHNSIIRKVVDQFDLNKDSGSVTEEAEECLIPHLSQRLRPTDTNGSRGKVACSRIAPVAGSCTLAREMFVASRTLQCDSKLSTLCTLQGSGLRLKVECDIKLCALPVVMGTIQPDTGELLWKRFRDKLSLQQHIAKMVDPSNSKPHFGFCFLKCLKKAYEDYMYDIIGKYNKDEGIPMYDDIHSMYYMSQLLTLPPVVRQKKTKNHSLFNINMIFIDSVSRHHFYRTLPETIKVMESINHDNVKDGHGPVALDFELIQSMRSRTFETLQALFSGYVDPSEKPFGVLDMPPVPLSIESLFGPFKALDYHTLWLEDLCWEWEWGISKDLRAYNKSHSSRKIWKRLHAALKKAGIDGLDTTLSSCEILRVNNVNDHFHGPDTVCYGGQFQHQFALDYLKLYQSRMASLDQRFISFLETNVGHEDTGRRIKTLDQSLASYLKFASTLNNTLTILFSDHGNAYGNFLDVSLEGRVEMFHPFLMMVLPEKVRDKLGPDQTSALISNQDKLISLLDLHHMLYDIAVIGQPSLFTNTSTLQRKHLSTARNTVLPLSYFPKIKEQFQVPDKGLLSRVSPSRTCDQMPRIMPNLCICEGFENSVKNDSHLVMFAHFALSKLNSVIHSQYRRGSPDTNSSFGRCRRLVLHSFRNVKTNFGKNHTMYLTMELSVRLTRSQPTEVFFVALTYSLGRQGSLTLTKFDRTSPYSGFKACADPGVDLNLCVCDVKTGMPSQPFTANNIPKSVVLAKSKIDMVDKTFSCLLLLTTENDHGVVLEAFNLCPRQAFKIQIRAITMNLLLTTSSRQVVGTLRPFEVKLMVAAVEINPREEISWRYKISLLLV
ncbi:uncharacterized protein LOC110456681 [Mizuhopecten yessoensis]|uniref:Uncharacterized protein n=1 Tax=Mizuhopecten yessoensis TaxID=6573 RepID=A0A210QAH1_MIZYE|nr:uncharacterized protein LOC110456681 [Mizuhopecten yessoensis]OWF45728.1 hypothetical protein KP79_PYT12224 [Mizuhopecten yessoensis]